LFAIAYEEKFMKKKMVSMLLGACLVVPAVSFSAGQSEKKAESLSFKEKLSYSMGFEVGNYFKGAGDDIQKELLLKGINDAYNGSTSLLTREEMVAVQKQFAREMEGRQKAEMAAMMEKNRKEGAAYLEKNSRKKGVIVTKSGLQYEVLTQGKGKKPTAGDRVKVDYVGQLISG
jgi:peptidylprolyl isomerase/FKBP-type peptidyl-prolyl cis-trans isomerase FklB